MKHQKKENKKMKNVRKNTTTIAIIAILMLTFSTVAMFMPTVVAQKITATATFARYDKIGVNSPTRFAWRFSGNLLQSSAYEGQTSIWPDAVVTFTRPDNTIDVVNGPFKMRPSTVQGRSPDVVLIYAPDMIGDWTIDFYWPGDGSYNAVSRTGDTFTVGEAIPKRECLAMLSINPYPAVGLLQDLLINAWVSPPPYDAWDIYEDYTFTYTAPSGASFVVGPMDSEAPGTVWFDLPLTEIGEWTIKFDFPGDFRMLPCSITRTVTVQEEWVTVGYPDTPLPTESWTFPINTHNREWRNIAGPWYQRYYNASRGSWNPYTEAPRTAHILWKISSLGQLGGYIGSPHSIETGGGEEAYAAGDAGLYSSSSPSITTVMAGRGYYTAGGNINCVDMRTGEMLWSVPGSFNVGTERNRAAVLYSFGSRFIAYDAITGDKILDVEGLNGMTFYEDPYVYRETGGRLIKWTTEGSTNTFANRVIWNVTAPYDYVQFERWSTTQIHNGLWVGIGNYCDPPEEQVTVDQKWKIAFNTTTGEVVYRTLVSDPTDPKTWINKQGPKSGSGYGLYYTSVVSVEGNEGRGFAAWDVATGNLAWFSESADYPWGNFWAYMPEACGYGMIFGCGYTGVYGFNVTNGEIVWHYIAEDSYYEEPYASNIAPDGSTYSSYTFGSTGPVIGGGIVFAPNTEHSPTFIYRGQQLHAIDAFTGEKVWTIKGVYTPSAIAYGILLASDSYNGFTYAFGKGETETTVSTSSKVIAKGESILLEGTVLDMSPAQEGTAAVSDASQTAYMEYLHMQQPFPLDATGVEVSLDALDPNGNFINIGTATSDTSGQYSFGWKPENEGKYTIIASFMGSEAYYDSFAETTILVTEAPSPAGPIEPEPTEPTEAPFITTEIAIIIAVVVVAVIGIVAYWALRKRK